MEVDDQIQCKFPRISNGDGRLDSAKLGHAHKMDDGQYPDEEEEGDNKRANAAAGVGRFYGWPSSRIVRVSRASGGKDRHSKVLTSKGLRDRRVRLSVNTAIQFYDLQDRLGYDQPSKAVEWLLKAAASSIAELPPMNTPFPDTPKQLSDEKRSSSDQLCLDSAEDPNYSQQQQVTKSSACSSTSETSKGSGLSLSRSESRIKARERAKERVAEKKDSLNPISHTTSFTELLNGGAAPAPRHWPANPYTSAPPLFSEHHHPDLQHLSFVPDHLLPGGNSSIEYNLNFTISSSPRGTLQSNSSSPSLLPHLQRYSDGSAPSFFIGTAETHHQFLSGYDSQRGKAKN